MDRGPTCRAGYRRCRRAAPAETWTLMAALRAVPKLDRRRPTRRLRDLQRGPCGGQAFDRACPNRSPAIEALLPRPHAHERLAAALGDELAVLVEGAMVELDNAGARP